METKIIGCADVHLGFRQYGLRQREQDIEQAFEHQIVQYAIDNQFHAVVVAGDLLDSVRPSSRTYEFLRLIHKKAVDAGLPILVSPGNHDASIPHWLSQIEQSLVAPGGFKLMDNNTVRVNNHVSVHGVPCMSRQQWEAIAPEIPACHLLLMHQTFKEFIGFPSETAFCGEDLRLLNMCKTVLVGDIHVNREFCAVDKAGNTLEVISPGSTELMSITEDASKSRIEFVFKDDTATWSRTPIETRKIVLCDFTSCEENETEAVIANCVAEVANSYPILRARYFTPHSERVQRLRRALVGKEYLFKSEPVSVPAEHRTPGAAVEEQLRPIDIVRRNLDANSNIFPLLSRLFDKDCNAKSEVDEYIERRLGNRGTTNISAPVGAGDQGQGAPV